MYRIGEHVIHPGQGVCTVVGFKEVPAPMLVLEAKRGHAKTLMQYPVSQASKLHPCISAEAAERLIVEFSSLECDPFTERNSTLEETYFKQRIKQGAPETVRVAKTMLVRIRDAKRRNKKPSSYYARVLKEARRRALEELACALEVSEEDLDARFCAIEEQDGLAPSAN